MKVLINCLSSVSGGAVSYLANLVPELDALFAASGGRHDLFLLAHETQRQLFPSIPASRCILLSGPRLAGSRRALWERWRLASVVRHTGADVLFIPYQVGRRVGNAKLVLMFRNMEPFRFHEYRYSLRPGVRNHILKWQSANSLKRADRVIAVSDFVTRELVNRMGVSTERVRRIYHGRDEAFSPSGDEERDRRLLAKMGVAAEYILTSGSLLPYRRCEDVIEAFSRLQDAHRDLHLVIAGSGTDSRYARLIAGKIASASCGDRIRCVGHVGKEEMQALYRHCRLFVFATEVEACPNIAIEAMASGCAILCADKEPLPEIVGDAAVRFRPRDVDDLAEKTARCLQDESLRERLRERALARAKDFSWKRCAQQTYAALTDWPGGQA